MFYLLAVLRGGVFLILPPICSLLCLCHRVRGAAWASTGRFFIGRGTGNKHAWNLDRGRTPVPCSLSLLATSSSLVWQFTKASLSSGEEGKWFPSSCPETISPLPHWDITWVLDCLYDEAGIPNISKVPCFWAGWTDMGFSLNYILPLLTPRGIVPPLGLSRSGPLQAGKGVLSSPWCDDWPMGRKLKTLETDKRMHSWMLGLSDVIHWYKRQKPPQKPSACVTDASVSRSSPFLAQRWEWANEWEPARQREEQIRGFTSEQN